MFRYLTEQQKREKALEVAQKVLSRKLCILDGTRQIMDLQISFDDEDEDWRQLIVIDSETEDLPVGRVAKLWNREALKRREPEIERAREWAWDAGYETFVSLVKRFNMTVENVQEAN